MVCPRSLGTSLCPRCCGTYQLRLTVNNSKPRLPLMLTLKQYSALRRYLGVPLLPHAGSSLLYRDWLLSLHCSQVLHNLKTSLRSALLPTARNTMASGDSKPFNHTSLRGLLVLKKNIPNLPVRSPRVRTITFIPSTCCIYFISFGQYWTSLCVASSSGLCSLSCSFCSSGRDFAAGFLQIRSHPRHPCLWLMIPTAKFIVHSGLSPPSYRPCRAH